MPKVNGKSFPYTPAGMAAAEKAEYSSKTPKAMKMAVKEGGSSDGKMKALKAAAKKKAPTGLKMLNKKGM